MWGGLLVLGEECTFVGMEVWFSAERHVRCDAGCVDGVSRMRLSWLKGLRLGGPVVLLSGEGGIRQV